MKSEALDWVKKAEGDIRVAGHEMASSDQPGYDAICFHSQQCAEKYLKAYLTEHGGIFPHTHVLVDLLNLCQPIDIDFATQRKDLEDLTVYGVQVRYPGFDATESSAREALEAATRVRAFMRHKLGL